MVVSKEQFMSGILLYIEREVIRPLPIYCKWGAGAMIFLIKDRSENVMNNLINSSFIQQLGVVDEAEHIDIDILCEALNKSAKRYGDIELTYPMIGALRFTPNDVDILKNYLGGEYDE